MNDMPLALVALGPQLLDRLAREVLIDHAPSQRCDEMLSFALRELAEEPAEAREAVRTQHGGRGATSDLEQDVAVAVRGLAQVMSAADYRRLLDSAPERQAA